MDVDKAAEFNKFGASFYNKFERSGLLSDVEEAVKNFQQAVMLTPDGHPAKPTRLSNLGLSFWSRFGKTGIFEDIEKAIKHQREALSLTPDGHPDKPRRLAYLGSAFGSRFRHTAILGDIEEAIQYERQSLLLTPDGHPDKPIRFSNLGSSFWSRFRQTGLPEDIEKALKHQQQALLLTPDGHFDKPTQLSNLGNSFLSRFGQTGLLGDIEEAIKHQRQALLLTPDGHPEKPVRFNNLGSSLWYRFTQTGVLGDIEEAIKHERQALSLTPDGHPDKRTQLSNLGSSFQSLFRQTGLLEDIEEAVKHERQALLLTPDGHPDRPTLLNNLGLSFWSRFRRTGVLGDIQEAINYHQQALLLVPDGHPDKPTTISNLGSAFGSRFMQTRVLGDIEEAIKHQRRALLLTPDGHPDKPRHHSSLGSSFQSRFGQTGVLVDIEEAIKHQREALLLTPDGHPDKPTQLDSLGSAFRSRFEQTGVLGDIEEAINYQRQALLLTPDGHPDRPTHLSSLGSAFSSRYRHTVVLDDIEEAIKHQQQALLLTPDGHPDKPTRFNNIGLSFWSRFMQTGVLEDIEEAISHERQALLLTPEGHPAKTMRRSHLGNFFKSRFEKIGVLTDRDQALSHLCSAATSSTGPPIVRSQASQLWARVLQTIPDLSATLDAYNHAIDLLPQIAWIGDPISVRHSQLMELDDLPREAVVSALDAERPDLALEWLEQGRSVVWNQLLMLRTSAKHLREAHPDLYSEFTLISHQLQGAAARGYGQTELSPGLKITVSLEEETQRHHRLAEKWDALVHQIRSLPGFERFLLPKKISDFKQVAELGPVVIINVHKQRCDALVLHKGQDGTRHIPLPQLSYTDVVEMQKLLKKDLAKCPPIRGASRGSRPRQPVNLHLPMILSKLFSNVVRPILQSLGMMVENPEPASLPRIWWCPTGPLTFLPLHAAGINTPDGKDEVSNYVVSSYIPTVNTLLEARARNRQPFERLVGVAMIFNPPHHRLNPLPNAQKEMDRIGNLFSAESGWSFLTLRDKEATRERVLAEMANCSWIHLACHAMQDTKEPTKSGLWLHDGPLTITDLISEPFQNADLAFLSACQTATGDEKSSDEAVHLTAAMLGAGYRSVIGTMWSIPDDVAPILAAKVYEELFSGGKPDSEKAARALHEGVKELQRLGYSSHSWVPFVHYGL